MNIISNNQSNLEKFFKSRNMTWKDIPDFEGLYQVSDCGQVKSLERLDKLGRFVKEKILKPGLNKGGYEFVDLWKEGVCKNYYVHRLVMYSHSNVDNELVINHIDENKLNNHISNLEYCTQGENIRKYCKNNPEFAREWGNKSGKANKERLGHKYLDTLTGVIYASMREVGVMMCETGQAKSKWVWMNILNKGLPQDRFIKID